MSVALEPVKLPWKTCRLLCIWFNFNPFEKKDKLTILFQTNSLVLICALLDMSVCWGSALWSPLFSSKCLLGTASNLPEILTKVLTATPLIWSVPQAIYYFESPLLAGERWKMRNSFIFQTQKTRPLYTASKFELKIGQLFISLILWFSNLLVFIWNQALSIFWLEILLANS